VARLVCEGQFGSAKSPKLYRPFTVRRQPISRARRRLPKIPRPRSRSNCLICKERGQPLRTAHKRMFLGARSSVGSWPNLNSTRVQIV
jgi:hypothetical protein